MGLNPFKKQKNLSDANVKENGASEYVDDEEFQNETDFMDENEVVDEGMKSIAKESKGGDKANGGIKKKIIPIAAAAAVAVLGVGGYMYYSAAMEQSAYEEEARLQKEFSEQKAKNQARVGTKTDKGLRYDEASKQLKETDTKISSTNSTQEANKTTVVAVNDASQSSENVVTVDKKPDQIPSEKASNGSGVGIIQSNDKKITDLDDIKEIEIKGDQAKKQIAESLSIGGDGNMDPFLMQYQSVIDNRKKLSVLQSTTELYDGAAKFLDAKLKYDKTNEIYRQRLEQAANEENFGDMKKTVARDFNGLRKEISDLRSETASLKEELEKERQAKNTSPLALAGNGSEKANGGEFVGESNGLIFTGGSNITLSPTYNGVLTTQTIYRIGDGYILEESDMNGNLKSYKVGQTYRGGVIASMTSDIVSLKFGDKVYLVTVGQSSGAAQSGYNYVSISKPTSSSIKNAKQVKEAKNSGPEDYGDVMRDRLNRASEDKKAQEAQIFRR